MKLPMIQFHCFLPIEMFQDMDEKIKLHKFSGRSEAFRHYVQLGLWVDNMKKIVDDPIKMAELVNTMSDAIKNDAIFELLEGFNNNQLSAIVYGVKMEQEKRSKQTTLGITR